MDETQNGVAGDFREKEICDLLAYFSHNTYSVPSLNNEPRPYVNDTLKLMEKDYIIAKIDNEGGKLCPQYPSIIPIIESARSVTTIYENEDETKTSLEVTETSVLLKDANLARCRQRFPVPVIFLNGKYVCRSSTLASEPEMCYRTGLINVPGYELLRSVKEFWWPFEGLGPVPEVHEEEPEGPGPYDNDVRAQTICDRVRNLDIKLLKSFNVNTIVDIMVEKRKVKHSLYVSASEKVDPKRYSGFNLLSLPYPGCEFFKDYHDSMFNAEGLKYKWDHPENDAVISVPNDNISKSLSISWQQYKEWDLVLITQNYMKYIIKYLQEESSGILVHCISGWDRTPLFISLIRLSLWADFLVHPSLNEYEILYFTITYDWYLFGHHLSNRLYKKEEIMAFCFDFLRYMTAEEFSAKTSKKKHSEESKTDESRSPSRSSSNSSTAFMDENNGHKKKKLHTGTGDYPALEINDNSNDSAIIPMDIVFEDSNSPQEGDMDRNHGVMTSRSRVILEDALMDTQQGEDISKNKILSPTTHTHRRTSPIPVNGGSGSRRQRSESTGSNNSNISSNWQMISDCGSIERDIYYKPQRMQRLEKVRTIFNSCYQKSVKNESFGPPKKWMIEEIVGSISNWTHWIENIYPESNADVGKNGNIEKNGIGMPENANGTSVNVNGMEHPKGSVETNGNTNQNGIDVIKVTENGSGDLVADTVNSND